MRGCLFHVWVILVLPWIGLVLTNLLADSEVANVVVFAVSALCVVLSLAIAQFTGLAFAILRLVRGLFGSDAEAPPSALERAVLLAGPLTGCVGLFTGCAALMWGLGFLPALTVGVWTALGFVYGGSMAGGLWFGLVDPDDADALGVYPEATVAEVGSPKKKPTPPKSPLDPA